MESLKDKAYFLSAIGRKVGKILYRAPSVAQCPGGGPVEPAQQLKQGGLSAPAGTGDGDEVRITALPDGTYEYTAVSGAKATVRAFDLVTVTRVRR